MRLFQFLFNLLEAFSLGMLVSTAPLNKPTWREIIIDRHNDKTNSDHDYHKILARASQPCCSLDKLRQVARNVGPKRSDDSSVMNSTIFAREMTTPKDKNSIEEFMKSQTGQGYSTMMWWRNNGADVNNAVFREFGQESFSYSMAGLAGCTGLVIVSKKGVYVAHYWESIGFSQEPDPVSGEMRYKTQDNAFYYTITRGLKKGIERGTPKIREQDSLEAHKDEIDDDSIRAYLMIPRTGNSKVGIGPEDPYRVYWEKLKSVVGGILPRLDPGTNPTRWHEYRYTPREDEEMDGTNDPLETTARGRLLFKFDPDHKGKKKTLFITETTIQSEASMEWD